MSDVSQKPSVCGQKAVLDILCQANKNSDNLLLSPKNISDIIRICKKQKPNMLETNPLCKRICDADSAVSLFLERLPGLLEAYNKSLAKNELGMSETELLSLNKIDLRNICPAPNKKKCEIPDILAAPLSDEESQFASDNQMFSQIPCYDKGVLQINKYRYIYYEILNLDLKDKTIKIFIQDYFKDNNIWQVGIAMTIDSDFNDIKSSNIVTYPMIYRALSPDNFNWSEIDKLIWKINIENAEKLQKTIEQRGYDMARSLTITFIKAVVKANYMLSLYKPSRGKRANKTKSTKRTIVIDTNAQQPAKLIRTVGPITFQSEKPPKQPTDDTVIHYRTASWTTRGHTRTYKNGKTVYVKESIHKRKCLQNEDTTTPQNIIQFKKTQEKENKT